MTRRSIAFPPARSSTPKTPVPSTGVSRGSVTLARSAAAAPSVPVVAAICAAEILGLAGFSIIPALLPQFIDAWSLTNTQAGWLAGIVSAGYMLAVIPASHHLRLSDLRDQLGDNVEMAKESEIDPLFADCAHGAVPPLGHCYALPLIVDDSIEAQPEIYMEAGDHETLLHISQAQFARLMGNARHGRFSEKLPHSISSSIVWG